MSRAVNNDLTIFFFFIAVADSAVTRDLVNSIMAPTSTVISRQTLDSLPSTEYKTLSSESSSGSFKSATQICPHDSVPAPRHSIDYEQKIMKNQTAQVKSQPYTNNAGTHYVPHTATPIEADKPKAFFLFYN